jgi:hypothetical protein
MKLVVLLTVLLSFYVPPVIAGEGGRGADDISRLMNEANNNLVPEILKNISADDQVLNNYPKVRQLYAPVRELMLKNTPVPLEPVGVVLEDSVTHVKTWINTLPSPGSAVRYNQYVEIYQKFVHLQPDQRTVVEHLLHEIGHQYGMNEDEAWTFAQVLTRAYRTKTAPKRYWADLPDEKEIQTVVTFEIAPKHSRHLTIQSFETAILKFPNGSQQVVSCDRWEPTPTVKQDHNFNWTRFIGLTSLGKQSSFADYYASSGEKYNGCGNGYCDVAQIPGVVARVFKSTVTINCVSSIDMRIHAENQQRLNNTCEILKETSDKTGFTRGSIRYNVYFKDGDKINSDIWDIGGLASYGEALDICRRADASGKCVCNETTKKML